MRKFLENQKNYTISYLQNHKIFKYFSVSRIRHFYNSDFSKRRKEDKKIRHAPQILEVIPSNRGTTSHSITKEDMKQFEEKLETFKKYWIDEAEKYAKIGLLEHITDEVEKVREHVMDLAEAEKRDIKSLEDKLEVFAEDIENSVDSGRASDRAYVDEKIKTMQKHGIPDRP